MKFCFRVVGLLMSLLVLVTSSFSPALALDLGIGLGWNVYNKDAVNSLGFPWVYNWGHGDTTGNGNDPYYDFGDRYIPMLYGCSATGVTNLQNWITANNYSGYVLVFNEPDQSSQGNCSPSTAADVFNDLDVWKKANPSRSGLKFIVGGPANGPSGWMVDFISAYDTKYTKKPPLQGIHFHIYPDNSSRTVQATVDDMKGKINGWVNWLNNSNQNWLDSKEVWITEYGVTNYELENPPRLNDSETDQVFNTVTAYINSKSIIDRAAWFSFSNLPANDLEFQITSLSKSYNSTFNSGLKSKYYKFRDLCTVSGYCNPITVQDTSVSLNLIRNTLGKSCAYSKWCTWRRNSTSGYNITAAGDLQLTTKKTSGNYGSCWIQWVSNPENGAQYQLKGNYISSNPFPNNKAFMQIEIRNNANSLTPPIYLNGSSGSFDRTFTYSQTSDFMSVKFCTWGSGLTSDREVTLTNLSLTKLTGGGSSNF